MAHLWEKEIREAEKKSRAIVGHLQGRHKSASRLTQLLLESTWALHFIQGLAEWLS